MEGVKDISEVSLEDLLKKTKIVGGRATREEAQPGTVTVITEEEIQRSGARTFADVLRTLAGFDVMTDSLGRGRIFVRGVTGGSSSGSSENVLVLWNGHRLNEEILGGATAVNLTLPVDNIKKLEVTRGPGAAFNGPGACLATINIQTESVDSFRATEVTVEGGEDRTLRYNYRYGQTIKDVSYAGFLQFLYVGGADLQVPADAQTVIDQLTSGKPPLSVAPGTTVDDRRATDANLSVAWRGLQVNGRLKSETAGGFIGPTDVLGESNRLDNKQIVLDATYSHSLGSVGELKGHFGFTQNKLGQFLQVGPPGTVVTIPAGRVSFPGGVFIDDEIKSRRFSVEVQLERDLFKGNTAVVGLGFERESTYGISTRSNYNPDTAEVFGALETITPTLPDSSRRVLSVFVQDSWDPLPKLGVSAGLRLDGYGDFGTSVAPRLGAVWRARSDLNLKLLYGRAVRVPSFAELWLDYPGFVANPNLEPARVHTLELAGTYRHKELRLDASLYLSLLRNYIGIEPAGTATAPLRRFVNLPGIDARGFEVTASRSFGEGRSAWLTYALQSPQLVDGGGRAPDAPTHMLNLGGSLDRGRHWSFGSTLRARTSRPRAAGDPRPDLGGYVVLDAKVRLHDFYKTLELWAAVNDLFDKGYFDPAPLGGVPGDYPLPGRRLFIKARYRF